MLSALLAGVADVTVGGDRLRSEDLLGAVCAFAEKLSMTPLAGDRERLRVAVVAQPSLQSVVAIAGGLLAGASVVPVNPAAGEQERAHVLTDSRPDLVVDPATVDLAARSSARPAIGAVGELIVYTSGTTGPPKGVVVSGGAMVACLDGLAAAWRWTADDVLAHALPLFHVHGLVLGTLGPLRLGSRLVRTQAFAPVADASMYFAVPTMWGRLDDDALAAMREARLLVSGSAALPARVFDRVRAATGHELVERYGLTESLIVTAADPDRPRSPGNVGLPIAGVGLRIAAPDEDGLGEVHLTGPTLFDGYLNRSDATRAALTDDGWLRTGDLGRYDDVAGLRLLGRMATDLIKTGGFKVGAGEVEDALLAHPAVVEAAVTAAPDDDLGERIVAWVVVESSGAVSAEELTAHVASTLSPHKRPRDVRFVEALPRNAMGKLQKSQLH